MNKLNIIYYSLVRYSEHGGSVHANQFLTYASAHPGVDKIHLFPNQPYKSSSAKVKKLTWIKSFRVFLIPRFLRRNRHFLNNLISFIELEKPDVLIMRPDHNFLQLKKLRRLFPDLLLVAEINSSSFDESYSTIPLKSFFKKLERETYRICDLNCFVTKELRNSIMAEKFDSKRDLVIHNGTNPDKFNTRRNEFNYRKKVGIADESIVIGYMGTLDMHKKMYLLIETFARLTTKFPNLVLLIVGDGPDRESIEKQNKVLGITSSVIITGWVDYAIIEEYLFAMDIAVHHHSNSYCCPLKIFDYMAAGLPTIGPNIPFIQEQFQDEVHLVKTLPTVDSIFDSILGFLENPDWASKIASQGQEFVINNFTWAKSANHIIDQIVLKLDEKN
ncbi:glycosyltransferase family 4 protein [Algoriphagus sp. C2-6-M1]|uniref:glycosyltransferase family 4 protein n=1 Tax=Algoriphagus persicinus TaxID=3108754 RepID=UPI002B3CC3CE|nr:glycosyltransferase family 4 protein [Algoriphagus sp. C2-6-M1]MEB2782436.1 glycosyltransferase family 4 protein [Algoriphagus sp. C2-6-M1]